MKADHAPPRFVADMHDELNKARGRILALDARVAELRCAERQYQEALKARQDGTSAAYKLADRVERVFRALRSDWCLTCRGSGEAFFPELDAFGCCKQCGGNGRAALDDAEKASGQ